MANNDRCFAFLRMNQRADKPRMQGVTEIRGPYYRPEVNLFVDHSQIVQLECLRRCIWGTKDLWGRVLTYKE